MVGSKTCLPWAYNQELNRCVFNDLLEMIFKNEKKKQCWGCPYFFSRFRDVHVGISKSRKVHFLCPVSRRTGDQKFSILDARGAGVGETVGRMSAVGWAWQQQGGYDLLATFGATEW